MKLKNRQNFIKHVAEVIENNHGKDEGNESYIFGISGKWGEGKTTFLKDLAEELKNNEFETPIQINPWKFATDKISFLRYFVKSLSEYRQLSFWIKIRSWLNNENFIDNFSYDESKNKIHPGWLFFVTLLLFFLVVAYLQLPQGILDKMLGIRWFLILLFIPIVLAIIGKLISVQKSNKAISTLDEFEKKLGEILQNVNNKKIVIFVDDLDRVMPNIARDTLDNLRTFFENKKLSFVVAGDHTVLERYLGKELLPNSNSAEQIDEGRRFLKKIFNVYWRLPLPLKSELEIFIDEEMEKRNELINIFKDEKLNTFKRYLSLYFEGNFRHIIRFLDTVLFSFKVINYQISNCDKDEEKYLQELKDNPLLVVRSLMIQDLCNPLFEEILKNSEILSNLEYGVQKKDNAIIDETLEKFKEKLSVAQFVFIKKFLFEKPGFYNQYGPDVKSIKTFLYFAADASFGDTRGPLREDFKQYLKQGNSDEVKQSLLLSGREKLDEALDGFYELNDEITDMNEKKNIFLTLINALINMDLDRLPQDIFSEGLKRHEFSCVDMPVNERLEYYYIYWQWLDKFQIKQTEQYVNKFNLTQEDINNLNFDNKFGVFASKIIFDNLVKYYDENKSDALHKMDKVFEKLNKEIIKDNFQDISKKLINDFITDINNTDLSEKRIQLIKTYRVKLLEHLKEKILESIKIKNQDVWNWAIINLDKLSLERGKLEDQIIENLCEVNDPDSLIEMMKFANNKISELSSKFWEVILSQKRDIFIENIEQVINCQEFMLLSPDSVSARSIFEILYEKLKDFDRDRKILFIGFLDKNKWIWNQLDKLPKKRELKVMSQAEVETIKNALSSTIESWN